LIHQRSDSEACLSGRTGRLSARPRLHGHIGVTTPVRGSTTQRPCAPSVTQLGEVHGRLDWLRDGLRRCSPRRTARDRDTRGVSRASPTGRWAGHRADGNWIEEQRVRPPGPPASVCASARCLSIPPGGTPRRRTLPAGHWAYPRACSREEMLERARRGSGVVWAQLNDLIEGKSTGMAGGVLGEYLRGVASPQGMDAAVEEMVKLISGSRYLPGVPPARRGRGAHPRSQPLCRSRPACLHPAQPDS
jgi:hypothetical protein